MKMSTSFLYFEFYNADFKCQLLGIFAFPTITKPQIFPQHPPTCTLHSGFCSQKSWVISWLLNMLGERFSIFNIFNDTVLSSNIFMKCHSDSMYYFYCMQSLIHSFICLRDIASYIKVRIQSALKKI